MIFLIGTPVQVYSHGSPFASFAVYVKQYHLQRKDGGALAPNLPSKEVTVYVLCQESHNYMVP